MLGTVVAVGAAITLLYAPVAIGVARQWYADPATSHGVALTIAALVILWRRRQAIARLPATPSDLGFAALGVSLFLYVVGTFAGELFVLRTSAIASIAAVVLTLAGATHLRLLATPLVLLLLAIPLPATVVTALTLRLQLLASHLATGLLTAGGIPVVREGNVLTLNHVSLEVADACSGLRSIVSLVAMVAMFKGVTNGRLRHAVVLSLATIPVAVAGNTLRVAGTGALSQWFGAAVARGFVHDLTGYVAFITMCGGLALLYGWLRRRERTFTRTNECESPALAW